MKKMVLCFLIVMLMAGCSVVRIDTSSIDVIVDVILSKDNDLYNRVGRGYKYYVPRGVTYIDTDELNDKLYSDGNNYYLYVDTVSYYNKIPIEYEEDPNLYYSRKISKDDFKYDGYLEITAKDDLYYINFVYNYAHIESVVNKEDINDAVLNSAYILSAIQFNPDVIKLTIEDAKLNNREEKYDKFKNKKDTDNTGIEVFD